MAHPDEIVRKCREKLKDPDNLSPREERELRTKIRLNEAKQDYYAAKEKVLQDEGVLSWLFF